MKELLTVLVFVIGLPVKAADTFMLIVPVVAPPAAAAGGTVFAQDNFTDTNNTDLEVHVSVEDGGTWHIWGAGNMDIFQNHTKCASNTTATYWHHSSTPTTANYSVRGTFSKSNVSQTSSDLTGRTTDYALTTYAIENWDNSGSYWDLYKNVSGSATTIGSYSGDDPSTAARVVDLIMDGTTISVEIDGTERISVTDSAITFKGWPGVGNFYATISNNNWIDNFSATGIDF